jgi:hypothetical protein
VGLYLYSGLGVLVYLQFTVYIYEVCTVALESTYEYYRITTDYPLCSLWRYFNRLQCIFMKYVQ